MAMNHHSLSTHGCQQVRGNYFVVASLPRFGAGGGSGSSPSRGGNSKPVLPVSSTTRYALNGRPDFAETNFSRRSVLPAVNSFWIWVESIGCWRITLPHLNLHGRESAWLFSQR